MIEAVPVIFIAAVAVTSYVAARVHVAKPENHDAVADALRLKEHRVWLRARLEQARREKWDADMVTRLAEDLAAVDVQLARLRSLELDVT